VEVTEFLIQDQLFNVEEQAANGLPALLCMQHSVLTQLLADAL